MAISQPIHIPHDDTNASQLPTIMSTLNTKMATLGRSIMATPKRPPSRASSWSKSLPVVVFAEHELGVDTRRYFLKYKAGLSVESKTCSSILISMKVLQSRRKGDGSRSRSTMPSLPASSRTPKKLQGLSFKIMGESEMDMSKLILNRLWLTSKTSMLT